MASTGSTGRRFLQTLAACAALLVMLAGCGGSGGTGETSGTNATAPPDAARPSVALNAPAGGSTVSGVTTISASAADDVAVTRVEFYLDGVLAGSDSSAPYALSWDTASLARGSYTWSARAYDAAGNAGQSAGLVLQVPIAVTMSTLMSGATAVGTVCLTGVASPAPYGLNLAVSVPPGVSILSAAPSGTFAASGFAPAPNQGLVILASSALASGEVMRIEFAGVPAGALPADFGIALSAVYDGFGVRIQ